MTTRDGVTYRMRENVRYVVEQTHIFILNEHTRHILHYPEAAVWDFLQRDYSYEKATRLLCKIAVVTPTHAELIIRDCLCNLLEKDFLVER